MKYLLIISCSQRKIETPGVLPAIDRYDGTTYRCLKKLIREGKLSFDNLGVLIISARHGIVTHGDEISNYDLKMTPERADNLSFFVQARLKFFMRDNQYDQVFINLGKTYMRVLNGFDWGLVSTMEASGGIGLKTQQMKAWLERIAKTTTFNAFKKL